MSESNKEQTIELKGFKLEVPEVKIRIEGGKTYISAPNVIAHDVQITIEDGRVSISGSSKSGNEPEKNAEGKEGEAQEKGKIGKMPGKIKNWVKTLIHRSWITIVAYLMTILIGGAIWSYLKGGVSLTAKYFNGCDLTPVLVSPAIRAQPPYQHTPWEPYRAMSCVA